MGRGVVEPAVRRHARAPLKLETRRVGKNYVLKMEEGDGDNTAGVWFFCLNRRLRPPPPYAVIIERVMAEAS